MSEATPNRRRTLALAVGAVLVAGVVLGRRSLSGRAAGGDGGCQGANYRPEAIGSVKEAIEASTATSLCRSNACTETLELMESDASFKSHFNVVQGDHVGTREHEKYFTSQATYANGALTLATVPAPPFPCKANGNFDLARNVVEGTCTYKSGAVYTRGLFTVNKKGETLIPHGAIEVDVTIAANGNVTLGKGLWPAIWMMSNRLDDTFMHDGQVWEQQKLWPSAMELDILEYLQGSSVVTGTLHYGLYTGKPDPITSWNYVNNTDNQQVADWTHVPGNNVLVYRSDPTTRHTFGFQWKKADTSVELTWYYDGNPYYNYSFRKSLGDGGKWEYAKTKRIIDSSTKQWRTIPDLECIKSASWSCANAGACIQAAQVLGKCPDKFVPDADGVGDKLAYAMFQSFQDGFEAGYYLILNVAVGGDGVVKGGGAPASDITETMTIHGVKRHILSP
jgi:beta-glucanase (GH16 family)